MKREEGFLHLSLFASRGFAGVDGGAVLSVSVSAKVKRAQRADVPDASPVRREGAHELHDVRRGSAHRVPQHERHREDGEHLLQKQTGFELEHPLELRLHLLEVRRVAPPPGEEVRVRDNLTHPSVGFEHPILLAHHPPRRRQHGAHHRRVPQQVSTEHLGVEQSIVDEERARQRKRHPRADEVRHEFGNRRNRRGGKLADVSRGGFVRRREALFGEMRELVELAEAPYRAGGPLSVADASGVVVKFLDVVEEEVHHHEERDERREREVDHREETHARAKRGDVVKRRADGKIVVEHVVEDGVVDVPLHRLGQPLLAPQTRDVEGEPQHPAVEHAQQVILLAEDARHYVVLVQIPHDAQARGGLQVHHSRHHLGPRDGLDVAIGELQLANAKRAHLQQRPKVHHQSHQAPGPVHGEEEEIHHHHEVGECGSMTERGGEGGVPKDVARVARLVRRLGARPAERLPVHVQEEEPGEEDGETEGEEVHHAPDDDAVETFLLEVRVEGGEPRVEVLDPEGGAALLHHEVLPAGEAVAGGGSGGVGGRVVLVALLDHRRKGGVVVVVHVLRGVEQLAEARHGVGVRPRRSRERGGAFKSQTR